MPANTRKEPADRQHGRMSVAFTTVLVMVGAGAMALTFAPAGFSPIVSPGVLTAITGINVSAGEAVAAAPKISPQEAATEGRHFVAQAPFSPDHSVLNNPDLLPTPNPAPMAVAAYD